MALVSCIPDLYIGPSSLMYRVFGLSSSYKNIYTVIYRYNIKHPLSEQVILTKGTLTYIPLVARARYRSHLALYGCLWYKDI